MAAIGKAQPYKFTYYLDENIASVSKTQATMKGRGFQEDSLFRLDCFTLTGTTPYMTFHFKDSSLSDLSGPFISYHPNGKPNFQGNYLNTLEDGLWQKWDSSGRKTDSSIYSKGLKMVYAAIYHFSNGQIYSYAITDSLKDRYQYTSYDSLGKKTFDAFFIGMKGKSTVYNADGTEKVDSVFTRTLVEAEFPGGLAGWSKYLRGNLDPNTPVDNNAPKGVYTVIVKFIIRANGTIAEVQPETNHRYGMEAEAIRVISNGPAWNPAVRFGQNVDGYRRQPVTFVVQKK